MAAGHRDELQPGARAGSVVSGRNARARAVAQGAVGAAVALGAWEYVAGLELVRPEYLPSALTVARFATDLVADSAFLFKVLVTLGAMGAGLALAVLAAVPIGLLLGRFPRAYRMTRVLVEAMRPIPALALAPLAILLFGLSEYATVSLVVWTSVWPILINSIYGMHNVDPVAYETARSFGLSSWETVRRVALPSAAPFIGTGIRIAAGIALSVAVAGEMVAGGGDGIGGWIVLASSGGSLVPVYAASLFTGTLGYLLNTVLEWGERRLFSWHSSLRGGGA